MVFVIASAVKVKFKAFTRFTVERIIHIGRANSAHKFALLCIGRRCSLGTAIQSVGVDVISQLFDSHAVLRQTYEATQGATLL